MRTFLLPLLVAFSIAAGAAVPAPALASDKDRKAEEKLAKKQAQEAALAALQRGEILPLTRIMAIATTHIPGDIIEIEYKAGPLYEVEVLTPSGRIREIKLDARTGEVIKIKDK
ncbi:MAG: PepSY domain-containing protein [Luteimonas sp.]|nr:PepSY domain-containing protein [Luteimonas sp.]